MFTPTLFEMGFAEKRTREPVPRIGLLVLLKTFQRLGYFVKLSEVPKSVVPPKVVSMPVSKADLA